MQESAIGQEARRAVPVPDGVGQNMKAAETSPTSRSLSALLIALIAFALAFYADRNAAALYAAFGQTFGFNEPEPMTNAFKVVLWLTGAWLISAMLNRFVFGPYILRRTGAPMPGIVANTIAAVMLLLAIFGIAHFVFGGRLSGLLATSGVVTIVIGFSIREMIADFFSGVAISVEQPYRMGDWIEVQPGVVGRVIEMNWRATRLVTESEQSIIVPNNDLASRLFVNYSMPQPEFRESLEVILSHTTDSNRAQNILRAAVLATEGLAPDRSPDVKILRFDERGVVYAVRFWVSDYAHRANLLHRVAKNILQHLDQVGIVLPVAQSEVFLTRNRPRQRERRIDSRGLLSRIDWLDALNMEELEQLASAVVSQQYAAGEVIVRAGASGGSLYLLVEGTLEATAASGERFGQIEPGEAFGEMSLLTGEPRSATVTAQTEAFVLKLSRSDFVPILRARPAIAKRLGEVMASRRDRMRRELENDNESGDEKGLAGQIARRISVFFGLSPDS